jgi:hypothetical protein
VTWQYTSTQYGVHTGLPPSRERLNIRSECIAFSWSPLESSRTFSTVRDLQAGTGPSLRDRLVLNFASIGDKKKPKTTGLNVKLTFAGHSILHTFSGPERAVPVKNA